jgi:hypothetical protein
MLFAGCQPSRSGSAPPTPCSMDPLPDPVPSFFLNNVETTVRIQTFGAPETTEAVSAPKATDEWPRIGATAWSETNKPDCLKRMSRCSFFLFTLLYYVWFQIPRQLSFGHNQIRLSMVHGRSPTHSCGLARGAWRDKLRLRSDGTGSPVVAS